LRVDACRARSPRRACKHQRLIALESRQLARALDGSCAVSTRTSASWSFAADVVHELKNPLASIRNANEMIGDVRDAADRRFVLIDQEVARWSGCLRRARSR
jgi:signal transduction histidine kinase